MHVYIAVAITFAIAASVIAYSKGRNSLGWFLAGLLIGPFALIVAALGPVPREGLFVQCGACCEVIRAEATICRYCGRAVKPRAPEPDGSESEVAI